MTMIKGEEMREKLQDHLRRIQTEPQIKAQIASPIPENIETSNVQVQET